MTLESVVINEWEARLSRAIGLHGSSISTNDILAILADAAEPSAPVTLPEKEFLTKYAGLTDEDLTPRALLAVEAELTVNRAVAARDVQNTSFSTQEVAKMLSMAPANVRRAVADGTLYSVKTSPGSHHWFPRWQFPHGRMLPGLRAVISALPSSYHPVEVEAFMTAESDELRGMSPIAWLAGGGDVSEIVMLAEERAWE